MKRAPDKRELARQLKAKRQELRAELARRRLAVQGERPPPRRRWWLLGLLLLLLLLLLRNCSCAEAPEPEPEPEPVLTGAPAEPVVVPPEPEPLTGRVERRDRPEFQSEPPGKLPWIGAFRMQVAARGPRLAECFVGVEEPGTLKWTASMEPAEGVVSDHTLEPTLLSAPLSPQQRSCVLAVLSEPPYRLAPGDGPSTPSRVSMVIEF